MTSGCTIKIRVRDVLGDRLDLPNWYLFPPGPEPRRIWPRSF